jgi:adenylate cyclase
MVEEIITALSRIKWLFVIARNSSFTYKGQAIDVKRVGRELGVRYVLEGSVRKAGQRVRITAQLIDAVADAHLWADRFDGSLEDVFELQDQVATRVAGVIEPALENAEMRRSAVRPTKDLTACDLYLRAVQQARSGEHVGYIRSLQFLGQAIERDPRYGSALALAAFCHQALHLSGWTSEPETNRREGIDLARGALRVAGDDPVAVGRAAYVLGYFDDDLDAAIALIDHSLVLNPSSSDSWRWSGWIRLWAAQPDLAIEHFESALRLNPLEPSPATLMGIGVGHFFSRRFEEARAMLLRSLQVHQAWVPSYRWLASSYAHMGRLDEARETVERLRKMTNVLVPSATQWRNLEHRELFLSGLRLAASEAT